MLVVVMCVRAYARMYVCWVRGGEEEFYQPPLPNARGRGGGGNEVRLRGKGR